MAQKVVREFIDDIDGSEAERTFTFAVDGTSAEQIKEALAKERINVTVAGTSTAVIDALERDLPNLVRASVHYFNTDEELERAVECVRLASRC